MLTSAGSGRAFPIPLSKHPAARRDPVIRGEKHDLATPVRYSKNQNLALEARDPLRRKVHHGDHLPAHESPGLIVCRELGAGILGPDLRSEVHHELDRRLACLRERLGLDDRAYPYIHLLELFPADLWQCTILWLEVQATGYRHQQLDRSTR